MARIQPTRGLDPEEERGSPGRRKAVRYLVPVAVVGLAAATIGLVPALADSGDPDLPKITAEQLVTKLADSDVRTVSGSVRVTTDLGLPGLFAGSSSDMGGSPFGPGAGGRGGSEDGADGSGGHGDGSTADPRGQLTELLSGTHTLRVAADGADRQRLSIVQDAAEYSVVHNGADLWAFDSESNEAFHSKLPEERRGERGDALPKGLPKGLPTTPQEAARQALKALDPTTSVTVNGTTEVAGRDAYQLLIEPKQSGSTVGSIRIAVDAGNGAPLKFTLTPEGSSKPAVDLGFTDVSFAKPAAKTFTFTPPKGARVTERKLDEARPEARREAGPGHGFGEDGLGFGFGADGLSLIGEGWTTVAKLRSPAGTFGTDQGKATRGGEGAAPEGFDPQSLLNSLGDQVKGDFGSGRVISSRLVNVLITDDGTVYAGAVDKDALVKAANGDEAG